MLSQPSSWGLTKGKSMTKTPKLTSEQKAQLLGDHPDTIDTLNSRLIGLAANPLTVDFTTLGRDATVLMALLDRAERRQRKPGTGRSILIITI
jgi:hypothetical protein